MADERLILVAEDRLSAAVGTKLVSRFCPRHNLHAVIVTDGSGALRTRLPAFAKSAHIFPFLVLTDLDTGRCAPGLVKQWLPKGVPAGLMLRVAVREVEAWLLADTSGLSTFLAIPGHRLPARPEQELDPKRRLVNAARKAPRRVREAIVPAPEAQTPVGPAYNSVLGDFVKNRWNPDRARRLAPSLDRTIARLRKL